MGGTQSESALSEFGISSASGLRFKGDNQGVVPVFIYVSYVGPEADHSITYSGRKKLSSVMRAEKPSRATRFISQEMIIRKLRGNLTSSWETIQKILSKSG